MRDLRCLISVSAALLVVAGCAPSSDDERPSEIGSAMADLGHVHAIDTDPADGTLYLATHHGVFALGDGGSVERIAGRWQDTMAFSIVGPGRFLASGHPDLRERDRPTHLGLVESTDNAQTWQPLSLYGEADFHALDTSDEWIFGYESRTGTLSASDDDAQTWVDLATDELVDLAAVPDEPGAVLATRPDGTIHRYEASSRKPEPISGAPNIVLLDWPDPALLVGVTPDGDVHHSADQGRTWRVAGSVPGTPQGIHVSSQRWYIATDKGLFTSGELGDRWEQIL